MKAVFEVRIIVKLKGEMMTDTVTIYTGFGRGDCGINFEIGKVYIIYSKYRDEHFNRGNKVPKYLTTNICMRTKKFEEKEFIRLKRYSKRKGYC